MISAMLFAAMTLSIAFTMGIQKASTENASTNSGMKAWAALTAKASGSAKQMFITGAMGAYVSTAVGIAAAFAWTGPVGAGASFVAGL